MPAHRPNAPTIHVTALIAALAALIVQADGTQETIATAEAMRLVKANCFSCHNSEKKNGGLAVTSREALLEGGESGPALVAGSPDQSALIEALAPDADPHMPPKKQRSPAQIAALTDWVKNGAPWDAPVFNEPPAPRQVTLAAMPATYHPVLALALSPDATRLAVGYGNNILTYDVTGTNPTLVSRASAHPDPVQSIAWSSDGKLLATGAFRRVMIWNGHSLAAEKIITTGLTDRISALRFLPDGKHLVLADGRVAEDGTVRLAELESCAINASWQAHGDTIFDMAVSTDGKLLATAGGDKLVKIWDLSTRKETARLEGHSAQVLTLAFNSDATQLVTGGADQQLKVWDVKTREKIMTLGRQTAAIDAVTWVPTGPAVLAATDSGAVLRYTELKPATGAQSSESAQERKLGEADNALYCLAATANGESVFAGSYDGRLFVWNKDGKLTAKIDLNMSNAPTSTSPAK